MKNFYGKQKTIIKIIISITLIILCFFALFLFISTFKYLSREGDLKIEHRLKDRSPFVNRNLAINNIKPWMTFNYLNVIFKIDPLYLKDSLNINDSKYPNIRIDQHARKNHLNLPSYIENIKSAITNYPKK